MVEWLRLHFLVWSGPEEPLARDVRIGLIDFFNVLLATALPWSTTLSTILVLVILIMMFITHGSKAIISEVGRPACLVAVAMVALAVLGMTWGTAIPWSDRLHGLEKVLKLLWIVPFFVHFRTTTNAKMLLSAYVVSNLFLVALSVLVFLSPELANLIGSKAIGVPLKNHIDQSQGFSFVAVVLLACAAEALRSQRIMTAICYGGISIIFLADLVFVSIARTAFIYLPPMLLLAIARYVRGRSFFALSLGIAILGLALWTTSNNLQSKVSRLLEEISAFKTNSPTIAGNTASGAERLEFWRKSVGLVQSAPLLGHGTGSTKVLFAAEAAGKTGIEAIVVNNPHNQLLAVAVQWGAVGCIILCTMWGTHLWLFRRAMESGASGFLAWIGLVAVVQNLFSCVFNAHLFDFYEGWLYVIAVAAIGGQLQREGCFVSTQPQARRLTRVAST